MWSLQDAKARFSELFRMAWASQPQRVRRRSGGEVVVISLEQFESLVNSAKSRESLSSFLARSPLAGSGLDLERDTDEGRGVDL